MLALAGVGLAAWLYRPILDAARHAEQQATDRLVAAWRDGATIPPADDTPPVHVVEALPPVVEEYIGQFDEAGRAVYEAKARSLLDGGTRPEMVVVQLDAFRARRQDAFA